MTLNEPPNVGDEDVEGLGEGAMRITVSTAASPSAGLPSRKARGSTARSASWPIAVHVLVSGPHGGVATSRLPNARASGDACPVLSARPVRRQPEVAPLGLWARYGARTAEAAADPGCRTGGTSTPDLVSPQVNQDAVSDLGAGGETDAPLGIGRSKQHPQTEPVRANPQFRGCFRWWPRAGSNRRPSDFQFETGCPRTSLGVRFVLTASSNRAGTSGSVRCAVSKVLARPWVWAVVSPGPGSVRWLRNHGSAGVHRPPLDAFGCQSARTR